MTLKEQEIKLEGHKCFMHYDVKEAVLKFEGWLSQFYNQTEEMELLSESEVLNEFRKTFGDFSKE